MSIITNIKYNTSWQCMHQKLFLFLSYTLLVTACVKAAILPEVSDNPSHNGHILGHQIDCEAYDEKNCTMSNDCTTKIEHCKSENDKLPSCFVLWSTSQETGATHIKMKGCFLDMHQCNQTQCITKEELNAKKLLFCCCQGSMCNVEQHWIPTTTESSEQVAEEKSPEDPNAIYIIIATSVLTVMITITAIGLLFYRRRKQANFNEIPTNDGEITNSSPLLTKRPIELLELKASGRFGDVWQAKLHNQDVAVKIFRMQEKDSWTTEIEIYKLPRMRVPWILEFVGYEKRTDPHEFWLITGYQHNGSLCDYLKSHTITWPELLKIAESMARGLMHLHEEIPATKSDGLKPSIAHRDFKSKNVLLKSDLTACIADFGLAMIFQPGKPCGDTHGQVGTRRYMAPEVLEGAINFNRDAFLRIDVYACGLVLWEMVSRCDAVGPVGEFQLPFEAELGQRPTLDEVQEYIVVKKLRPRILNSWRSHPGLNVVCDTMEECWDHDAEARLSSSCVVERLSHFSKYPSSPLFIENNTSSDEGKKFINQDSI